MVADIKDIQVQQAIYVLVGEIKTNLTNCVKLLQIIADK